MNYQKPLKTLLRLQQTCYSHSTSGTVMVKNPARIFTEIADLSIMMDWAVTITFIKSPPWTFCNLKCLFHNSSLKCKTPLSGKFYIHSGPHYMFYL